MKKLSWEERNTPTWAEGFQEAVREKDRIIRLVTKVRWSIGDADNREASDECESKDTTSPDKTHSPNRRAKK